MDPWIYPGYPAYIERAAATLRLPDVNTTVEARRNKSLSRLSDLVAQLSSAPEAGRANILAEAARSRDALLVAAAAGVAIVRDACNGFGVPHIPVPRAPAPEPPKKPSKG